MAKKIEVNKQLAQKVIEVVTPGLCHGLGSPEPGKMCVEAAVNYACGLPHGDNPSCVGIAVRNFKIDLNDSSWSSNKARANGMIKIAIAQLGSNKINQGKFRNLITNEFEQVVTKNKTDEIIKILRNKKESIHKKMEKIRVISDNFQEGDTSYGSLQDQKENFFPKMSNDEYFTLLADICLKVLKKMKSPGCKYLYLLNK